MDIDKFSLTVPPFTGKKRVKISTYGTCMNGRNGEQGSITDMYDHPTLCLYVTNSERHVGYDQPTSIRIQVIDEQQSYFLSLPWRC